MTEPVIGVGVPVWRAAAFVSQTLESVLAQRNVKLKLIISIDGCDTESEQACLRFKSDPRAQIVVQPRRLGWVGNTAAVLALARDGVEFACVQPHDDWIEPDYLRTLVDEARANPRSAVVFSDMIAFGAWSGVISQESITGTPIERQIALLRRHFNAVAFRGLIRASTLADIPPIAGNDQSDFACDTVWMARLARAGELLRVPRVLYHKRYDPNSLHAQWTTWSLDRKLRAWTRHCLDMLSEALTVARSKEERRLLIEMSRRRLMLSEAEIGPYAAEIRSLTHQGRSQIQQNFAAAVAARSDIGPLGHSALGLP
ncbi:MAG: glycosyltransferase family 2 protein [Alphaproteobacteria bacterium]